MYFTVKKYLRIGGRNYKPCISYHLSDYLFSTIKGLEAKGDAEITEKPVFFQNGSVIKPKETAVDEASVVAEEKPVETRKNHRKNRNKAEEAVVAGVTEGDDGIEGF